MFNFIILGMILIFSKLKYFEFPKDVEEELRKRIERILTRETEKVYYAKVAEPEDVLLADYEEVED